MLKFSNTACWLTHTMLAAFLFATPASAEPIVSLKPSEVEAYVVKATGEALLAVHYSSDDGSCSHCVTGNTQFRDAAAELNEGFDFAEVIANPWQTLIVPPTPASEFQERIGFQLLGLPAIVVFENGKPVAQINGANADLTDKLKRLLESNGPDAQTPSNDLVTRVLPSEISIIAKSMSAEKPLLLTLSSPDLGCPPCIRGTANVRKAASLNAKGWAFAQVSYNPWRSFAQDPALQAFAKEIGTDITGLPTSLVFYKGNFVAAVSPMVDVDAMLKGALPKVLAMDLPDNSTPAASNDEIEVLDARSTPATVRAPVISSNPADLPDFALFRDCEDCPEMVVIPAATFRMGSPKNELHRIHDEGPQKDISVPRFALSRFETTWDEWTTCEEAGTCEALAADADAGWGKGRRPVINLVWTEVIAYPEYLSEKTGATYRLPSESEWEYAARAGTQTTFSYGETVSTDQANYDGNMAYGSGVKGVYREQTLPVGSFAANPFGLFDMNGNVEEQVEDCFTSSLDATPTDGSSNAAPDCGKRVARGGGWDSAPRVLRSSVRIETYNVYRENYRGFRIARQL